MPDRVAVPLLLFTKVTPLGSAPVSVITMLAFVGNPVVVTVNVPATPSLKVALFALVIAGDWITVRVKFWVASGAIPLDAFIWIE